MNIMLHFAKEKHSKKWGHVERQDLPVRGHDVISTARILINITDEELEASTLKYRLIPFHGPGLMEENQRLKEEIKRLKNPGRHVKVFRLGGTDDE